MTIQALLAQAISTVLVCFATSTQVFAMDWENSDAGAAFDSGNITAVKRILSEGDYSGEQLVQALEHAILNGRVELVKYLATLGWLDACRKTPDCHTVEWATESVEMTRYLLSKGFPATNAALRSAAGAGQLEAVKLLCRHGANVDAKASHERFTYRRSTYVRRNGAESYSYAWDKLGRRDATLLEVLKDRPPYWEEVAYSIRPYDLIRNARSSAGSVKATEFIESGRCHKAAKDSISQDTYEQEVEALRSADIASVKRLFPNSQTATIQPMVLVYLFYEAVASGSIDLLHYLKSIGWVDRCKATSYCHPVAVAAQIGASKSVFEFLVSEGFAIDKYVGGYGTPLHYAVLSAHPDTVKLLCQLGANPRNSIGEHGNEKSLLYEVRTLYGSAWWRAAQARPRS